MLILTRKPGQVISIGPSLDLHPSTPIRDVFKDAAIEVRVTQLCGSQVKLGISAHTGLRILRGERKATEDKRRVQTES